MKNSQPWEYEAVSNKLWVTNVRLCRALNRVLRQYKDNDNHDGLYMWQTGEEAVFKVSQIEYNEVTPILNVFKN